MRYLLYCILRADGGACGLGRRVAAQPGRLPAGVEGAAVSLVTEDGLAAAVSRMSTGGMAVALDGHAFPDRMAAQGRGHATADVAHATAYAGVIAALSTDRTVLPLRYGCVFPSPTQVREFLQARRAEFAALLDELDGCVEMGVRVLLTRTGCSAGGMAVALDGHAFPDRMAAQGRGHATGRRRTAELGPGAAYLTARNAAYAQRDAEGEAGAATAAAIRRTFHHLSVQSRSVPAGGMAVVLDGHALPFVGRHGGRPLQSRGHATDLLVSMYFLIRREHIGAFRGEFRRLQEQGAYRLLLSGPWAPYNFVEPQELGAMG